MIYSTQPDSQTPLSLSLMFAKYCWQARLMVAKPRQQYLVLPVINSSGFNQFITSFVKNILEVLFEGFVILPGLEERRGEERRGWEGETRWPPRASDGGEEVQ